MEVEIFKKLKRHWPTVILAVVIGLLMVWPFFYFQKSLGDEYMGILNQVIDDELFYMARIKDVIDGHPFLGNAYLVEHKNQLPQQLFLPEFLLAQPLKLLNIDAVQSRVVYNFILPALAFILTYLVFYLIYPSKFWSNLFAVFLFFGIYLFKFTRPVIPQFVFLFWLAQFILLWQIIKNPSNRIFIFLNILNFGLLFYLYPFYWTFYLVLLSVSSFIYFFRDRLLSKQFLKILIGGLAIGSFYFYLTFLAVQLPEYQETMTRLQLVFSSSPSEIKTVIPALLILILFGILHRLKFIKINREILFFISGIISILLVTNQNIITGQKFEFGHYRMPAVFFMAFAIYYIASQIKLGLKLKFLFASILIIISAYGIYGYAQRVFKISGQGVYTQNYKEILDWFNKNTQSDSVVYANDDISNLIPVYTYNNVFYVRNANLFIISDVEAEERFILGNFFEDFDENFVVENERTIWGVRYIDRYGDAVQANKWRKLLGLQLKDETRLPENEVKIILAKAVEIKRGGLNEGLKKYQVDYFIWDKNKNPDWYLNNQNFLESVFKNNNFVIYKIK